MNYTENTLFELYVGRVKHIVGDSVQFITFPPTFANSFCMASAQFEKSALSMSICGIIIEIVVEKLDRMGKELENNK